MSEGIERLRAESARLNSVGTRESLDEIERLRADRDRWRKVADLCVMAIGVPENDVDRIAVREYDQAVRGE